jgi:hypothetical protein
LKRRSQSTIWKSGNYKTYEELAKALGYSNKAAIYNIIEAKEFRSRNPVFAENYSTYEIRLTSGLSDEERVEILKKKGSMSTSSFESFMSLYKASDKSIGRKLFLKHPGVFFGKASPKSVMNIDKRL